MLLKVLRTDGPTVCTSALGQPNDMLVLVPLSVVISFVGIA